MTLIHMGVIPLNMAKIPRLAGVWRDQCAADWLSYEHMPIVDGFDTPTSGSCDLFNEILVINCLPECANHLGSDGVFFIRIHLIFTIKIKLNVGNLVVHD